MNVGWSRTAAVGPLCALLLHCLPLFPSLADDWPEVHGPGRRNLWNETGILRQFPAEGLAIRWRKPIGSGYSGPAVAAGRVFVSDYVKLPDGNAERVVCLDEETGEVQWIYQNPEAAYHRFSYNSGPRATPTVDGDRVYVLGGAGDLYCLDVATGALHWQVNLPTAFDARIPIWGFAPAPLVWGDLLICAVNGRPDARLVALDKLTGKPVWRSLPPAPDLGYSSPVLVTAGRVQQLIHWHAGAIVSLNPATGEPYWEQEFDANIAVATPVWDEKRLFVSDFFRGPLMLKLAGDRPGAEVLWRGKGTDEINTDGLHALMCTPVLKDGYLYGVCSYGQFRCVNALTGERVWETLEVTREQARWATAFIVRNHEVFFINNDRGELIIADLSPTGYRELSRTQLITPTSGDAGYRELGFVNWVMPAYANRHIITRNDEEILRASLER